MLIKVGKVLMFSCYHLDRSQALMEMVKYGADFWRRSPTYLTLGDGLREKN